MFHALIIIVLAIASITFSVFMEDSARIFRGLINATILFLIVMIVWGYSHYYGVFGDPISLRKYYRVLSVTPLGDNSTAVILRSENDDMVPIRFLTRVVADTNGLYIVVGDNHDNWNLVPIK